MRRWYHAVGRVIPVAALVSLAGCEPITPEDKAFFDEQERLRNQRVEAMRAANAGVSTDDVIKRVRHYPAHEGGGTMEEWLDDQLVIAGGQVMFPRWSAVRRGSNIQEVSFDYVRLDSFNQMKRYRYAWDVDVLDMTVGEPKHIELEEIESPDQTLINQHIRRVHQHEKELE